jgi:hypothetical protein
LTTKVSSWKVKGYFFFPPVAGFFAFFFEKLWYNEGKGRGFVKKLMIGSTVMTVLVLARCIATIFLERYYGRTDWQAAVLADPWFYVGIVAVVLVYATALITLIRNRKT